MFERKKDLNLKMTNFFAYPLDANSPLTVPYPFIVTAISRSPYQETFTVGSALTGVAGDKNVILCNLRIDEDTYLFRDNVPFTAIPSAEHPYQLPCFWYLDRGSHLNFVPHASFDITDPTNLQLTVYGYFIETPTAEEREKFNRPLIFVFDHVVGDGLTAPAGTVGPDDTRVTKNLWVPAGYKYLIRTFCHNALQDLGSPVALGLNFANISYNDYSVRILYGSSMNITDSAQFVNGYIGEKDFPTHTRMLLPVSEGNAITIDSTAPAIVGVTPRVVSASYILIGGILVKVR